MGISAGYSSAFGGLTWTLPFGLLIHVRRPSTASTGARGGARDLGAHLVADIRHVVVPILLPSN